MAPRILIVCCHATPGTRGGVLVATLLAHLQQAGMDCRLSDLAAQAFGALGGPGDFIYPQLAQSYREAQKLAAASAGFAPEIAEQQALLRWAEHVVFVFPLRFFGMPALMKGWMERVLARGFAYGGAMEYASGGMQGKHAHALITAAAAAADYGPGGKHIALDSMLAAVFDLPMSYVGFSLGQRDVLCGVEGDSAALFYERTDRHAAAVVARIQGQSCSEERVA